MKKIFLLLILIVFPFLTFAAWSQPTAIPPSGNTQPPVNVGLDKQTKEGALCVMNGAICFDSNGIKLGGSSINNWTELKNILGLSNYIDTTANSQTKTGQLTVGKFCLAGICIANWTDLKNTTISPNLNFVSGSGTTNTITKWINNSTIGNSSLTDDGTNLCYKGSCTDGLSSANLWVVNGDKVNTISSRKIDSLSGLKLQILPAGQAQPSNVEDGMIWITQ